MDTCNDCIHAAVCGEPHIIYRCSGVCQHFKRETKLNMYNLYDSAGRKLIVDRTNGPWTPEGGYGGACHYEDKNITECIAHRINLYDQREVIEGYTVEILTNTLTGETSVVWWRGGVEDRPGMEEDKHD